MARAASRRQVKPAAAPPASNLISKYTRVSKAQVLPVDDAAKKAFFIELPKSRKISTTEISITAEDSLSKPLPTPVATPSSRKRKSDSVEDNNSPVKKTRTTAPLPVSLKRQRISKDDSKDEPAPVKKDLSSPVTTTTSPKNTTPTVIETHRKSRKSTIISHAKTETRKANAKVTKSKRRNTSGVPTVDEEPATKQLPAELLELLDLQRAILKTVSLQITHQNSHAPLDISAVTPHVSRTWGKRKVTTDDIRRCIAIQDLKPAGREQEMLGSPFIVTDYGRGKLCLEMASDTTSRRIDEQKLCQQFEENLHILCAERATNEMTDLDVCFENLSFNDLPKSEITVRHSIFKQNPALAKGQRVLTELKNGIVIKKQEQEAKAQAAKAQASNPAGAKMSLLDRLRAKEIANSQIELPSGPEMARKRALHRIGDIAAIISMLVASSNAAGQPVMSFTMPVLQQKLKESVRVPMPVEEGVEAVQILANEIAPEWLKIASVSGKQHVVIQTRRKPYEAELAARVKRLS
ncbi:hypothetical protein CkaCkLH20_00058 [Colletotrichum karsti]|uniref:DNA replication factor Cdt1 C-terminal domain-containing protein n=1 Tax=Colletotrichum karsti TaxID=1095194 RepID=A0A9P6IGG1_9PEZI|nr:uncharacterized protein CkaCkLH20_00058 [Colletotrichum karsti]KAF9882022.1 hypothetical protein CkaCkLH20_00058 [Colletotrichum karsti]